MTSALRQVEVVGALPSHYAAVLTPEALDFIAGLHIKFNQERKSLLKARVERQVKLDQGVLPDFLTETSEVRKSAWQVALAPADLNDRRVEITGPCDRKMMINAFNSGAQVFMADMEDSLSPTWENVVEGQINLIDAVRRNLDFVSPEGKSYKLNENIATLVLRPRGWHLNEKHVLVSDEPISASLFDFGIYFFHNAHELLKRKSGPYFYLPKMESHLEARLWNDVFNYAQDKLGIARGTIRATVLIETILAAFEMQEILYELRAHSSGLNAGRWDYIFSIIKKFHSNKNFIFPDRSQVTMAVPFMRAYCQLMVQTCHRRGAHAMGGMAAFIPSRKDAKVNEVAIAKVKEDKAREASDGFDGTWVAHPDLVPIAKEEFDLVLGSKPNQKEKLRQDVKVSAADLLNMNIAGGKVTETGVTHNVDVALQYIESWLRGIGAAAIYNLMEDAATAEIARAQIWQWIHQGCKTESGTVITKELYKKICQDEMKKLQSDKPGRFDDAAAILDELILKDSFTEFLTIRAYEFLNNK